MSSRWFGVMIALRIALMISWCKVLAEQMSLVVLLVWLRVGAEWAVKALLFLFVLSQGKVVDVVHFAIALQASELSAVGTHLCVLDHHQNDLGGVRVTLH